MSEIAASKPSSSASKRTAEEKILDDRLEKRFDTDYQRKLKNLRYHKFKNERDLVARWPEADVGPLEEEDGVYMWDGMIVLTQDIVESILEQEFESVPPSTGRIKFSSILNDKYIGISGPQITDFLTRNPIHQQFRSRKRSQRTRTTVASAPFKQLEVDLTDLPKTRGTYRYLLQVVDKFSGYLWSVPLAKKSGPIVAREIDKIFSSLPAGARVGVLKGDNGTEIKNPEVRAVLAKTGTKQVFGLPGNPLGQGKIEVSQRIIKLALFSELSRSTDGPIASFKPALAKTVRAYNNSVSTATGFRPAELNNPNLLRKVITEVLKRLNKNAQGTDVNRRYQPPLVKDDLVRIAVEELDNSIKQQIKNKTYKPSHLATFSKRVYTVVSQDKDNFVRVAEIAKDKFPRGSVLRIPKPDESDDDEGEVEAESDEEQ